MIIPTTCIINMPTQNRSRPIRATPTHIDTNPSRISTLIIQTRTTITNTEDALPAQSARRTRWKNGWAWHYAAGAVLEAGREGVVTHCATPKVSVTANLRRLARSRAEIHPRSMSLKSVRAPRTRSAARMAPAACASAASNGSVVMTPRNAWMTGASLRARWIQHQTELDFHAGNAGDGNEIRCCSLDAIRRRATPLRSR